MIGHLFTGRLTHSKPTPNGGKVLVSFGDLVTEENAEPIDGMYVLLEDKAGTTVAEFCMVPETFGTLMDVLFHIYNMEPGGSEQPAS